MSALVLDASATAPLFLNDETTDLIPGLAEALADGALVPAHWSLEVANLIRVARLRDRLDDRGRDDAVAVVRALAVEQEAMESDRLFGAIWSLADRYQLTSYDAAYVELARRHRLPLASNDRRLMAAAAAESVTLFGQ